MSRLFVEQVQEQLGVSAELAQEMVHDGEALGLSRAAILRACGEAGLPKVRPVPWWAWMLSGLVRAWSWIWRVPCSCGRKDCRRS